MADLEPHVDKLIDENLTGSGKFAKNEMMTTHELRDQVREKFGEKAASHEVFDRAILNLRRERKIELQGTSDNRDHTVKHFSDAIPMPDGAVSGPRDFTDVYMFVLKAQ